MYPVSILLRRVYSSLTWILHSRLEMATIHTGCSYGHSFNILVVGILFKLLQDLFRQSVFRVCYISPSLFIIIKSVITTWSRFLCLFIIFIFNYRTTCTYRMTPLTIRMHSSVKHNGSLDRNKFHTFTQKNVVGQEHLVNLTYVSLW